jgi:hypothetical protein
MAKKILDAKAGRAAKDKGQADALAGAGLTWTDAVIYSLRLFIRYRVRPGGEFLFESFRDYYTSGGRGPLPKSPNAWGAIPRIAARKGLIVWTGKYAPAKSIKTHAHPVKVWRVL